MKYEYLGHEIEITHDDWKCSFTISSYAPHRDPDGMSVELRGTMVWRGCWESRLYPVDGEELFGETLHDWHMIFQHIIKPKTMEMLKQLHPDSAKYMDEDGHCESVFKPEELEVIG